MKKITNKINFALIAMMTSTAAMAETKLNLNSNMLCDLAGQLGDVFKLLRTLAFVGAAFIIANWAWGYIIKPDDLKLDKVKEKGVGMLVGFIMLFALGAILQVFMNMAAPDGSLNCISNAF